MCKVVHFKTEKIEPTYITCLTQVGTQEGRGGRRGEEKEVGSGGNVVSLQLLKDGYHGDLDPAKQLQAVGSDVLHDHQPIFGSLLFCVDEEEDGQRYKTKV